MTRAADVDRGWIEQRLAANMSWSAIARMAGCSELDLKKHHDPLAVRADWTARPLTPPEQVRHGLRRAGFGPDHAQILARLWAARTARCKSAALASGIAGGALAGDLCHEAKRCAFNKGVTFERGANGIALTLAGWRRLGELAGVSASGEAAA